MKKPNSFFRYGLAIAMAVAAGGLLFPDHVRRIFSADGFMPHSMCYMNDPRMVWLHVVSDMFIGLAYVCISSTLAYLVFRANRNIPFHWMFLAFGLFILILPTTKLRHMVTSPLNMYLRDRERPKSAMRPMPNLMETELESFGAVMVEDFTW